MNFVIIFIIYFVLYTNVKAADRNYFCAGKISQKSNHYKDNVMNTVIIVISFFGKIVILYNCYKFSLPKTEILTILNSIA